MSLAVVTGANRGIGLEFCRQLKEEGFEVVGLCRQASEELQTLGVEVVEGVNVTDSSTLQQVKAVLGNRKVRLLVNNAGILMSERWPELNFDSIEEQLEVNTLGPLRTTQALSRYLEKGSQIVMVTSRMGSITDNSSGGYYGYRMSKAALNAGSKSLALDLKPSGIGVYIFHPGFVKTRMTENHGEITPREAVSGILTTLNQLSLEETGTFWHSNGEQLPW